MAENASIVTDVMKQILKVASAEGVSQVSIDKQRVVVTTSAIKKEPIEQSTSEPTKPLKTAVRMASQLLKKSSSTIRLQCSRAKSPEELRRELPNKSHLNLNPGMKWSADTKCASMTIKSFPIKEEDSPVKVSVNTTGDADKKLFGTVAMKTENSSAGSIKCNDTTQSLSTTSAQTPVNAEQLEMTSQQNRVVFSLNSSSQTQNSTSQPENSISHSQNSDIQPENSTSQSENSLSKPWHYLVQQKQNYVQPQDCNSEVKNNIQPQKCVSPVLTQNQTDNSETRLLESPNTAKEDTTPDGNITGQNVKRVDQFTWQLPSYRSNPTHKPTQFESKPIPLSEIRRIRSRILKFVELYESIGKVNEETGRPMFSYTELCYLALLKAPDFRVPTKVIYSYIEKTFPFFNKDCPRKTWKNAIRHCLSKSKCFFKTTKMQKTPGYDHEVALWTLSPSFLVSFARGDFRVDRDQLCSNLRWAFEAVDNAGAFWHSAAQAVACMIQENYIRDIVAEELTDILYVPPEDIPNTKKMRAVTAAMMKVKPVIIVDQKTVSNTGDKEEPLKSVEPCTMPSKANMIELDPAKTCFSSKQRPILPKPQESGETPCTRSEAFCDSKSWNPLKRKSLMFPISPKKRKRVESNPSLYSKRYTAPKPIDVNQSHKYLTRCSSRRQAFMENNFPKRPKKKHKVPESQKGQFMYGLGLRNIKKGEKVLVRESEFEKQRQIDYQKIMNLAKEKTQAQDESIKRITMNGLGEDSLIINCDVDTDICENVTLGNLLSETLENLSQKTTQNFSMQFAENEDDEKLKGPGVVLKSKISMKVIDEDPNAIKQELDADDMLVDKKKEEWESDIDEVWEMDDEYIDEKKDYNLEKIWRLGSDHSYAVDPYMCNADVFVCEYEKGTKMKGGKNPMERKIRLKTVNPYITCYLCKGYLIDATTITECLHTFCRSCIVKFLKENNTCPKCEEVIHQSHPMNYISHDRTMQDIVYKLVPNLLENERKKEERYHKKKGLPLPRHDSEENDHKPPAVPEDPKGDCHRSDEQVNLCLECKSNKLNKLKRKFLRCSSQATITHVKKFVALKLYKDLNRFKEVDILCNEEILGKDHTLKFVTVTRWRQKNCPLLLHYRPKVEI
ncbi:unnamed protein product [Owenia fusiformis]|uniref:RING-type domain-containing protein n=1 Tax=Owenia fusiformis TaxID=6347 RepID=A0A8S4NNN7_OWEFU|nr:unnamed protein product [Owenia fusiformis]